MYDENELTQRVRQEEKQSLDLLFKYLRFPSISAQKRAIKETIYFITQLIKKLGGSTKILDDCGGFPIIYGYFSANKGSDDTRRTLLFYDHYDVQPPDPLNEWFSDPFEPVIKNTIIYGRGTADNKGSLMQRFSAVKILREAGALTCNVKFLIEGEEEIGSPSLSTCLDKYSQLFRANACIWEFGDKNERDEVQIYAGVKGLAYFELTEQTAGTDVHSMYGVCVDNPAWRLVQALASMKDRNNNILIDDFFAEINEPSESLKHAVRQLPYHENTYKKRFDLKRPLITAVRGEDIRDALILYPSMTICGLTSGYSGDGAKAVLPREAKAKIDCRMVPGQTGQHLYRCIKRHLRKHGFSDVQVKLIQSQSAFRTDINDPFVDLVKRTAVDAYKSKVILYPNSPGAGPMGLFDDHLHLPIVSTGVGWTKSNSHAPNESIRIQDYKEGMLHMVYLLKSFSGLQA